MATTKPTNLQPVCQVLGCKNGAQILSLKGSEATWMRTCSQHTYQDLPKEKIETFWPPSTD
jgi:hypothetical protein